MTRPAEPFETLPMTRKDIPQPAAGSYRVYKSAKDFVVVEASSALEALQVSDVKAPYKIERESIDYISVLAPSAWGNRTVQAAPEATPEVAAEAKETVFIGEPAAAAKPAEADAAAPLSNEDVSKLLNN